MDKNTIKAVILGHAVGDALGVPAEFCARNELKRNPVTNPEGYGTFKMPKGAWSDDTSMTLCALSALSNGDFDISKVMANFGDWYYNGKFTPTGVTFGVGKTCGTAIENYFIKKLPLNKCGLCDERSNGNGSIMRILPFALYSVAVNGKRSFGRLWEAADIGSSLTHAHRRSVLACQIYSTILAQILIRRDKTSIGAAIYLHRKWYELGSDEYPHFNRVKGSVLPYLSEDEIKSSGYVVDTLEAALWCLYTTSSYSECVLKAVNLGGDTDTIAAVAGGLAGALYGLDAIPKDWLDVLIKKDYIEELCEKAAENWKRK